MMRQMLVRLALLLVVLLAVWMVPLVLLVLRSVLPLSSYVMLQVRSLQPLLLEVEPRLLMLPSLQLPSLQLPSLQLQLSLL
jgi:hypothetical protein